MKCADMLGPLLAGQRMDDDTFLYLWHHADLLDLAAVANTLRDQRFPDKVVTFIIDRNINYTNVCTCRCRFCAFYRDKSAPDAYIIDRPELYAKIEEAISLGATQLMIQGGLHPDLNIDFFTSMFSDIKARYEITIHSLTAPEVVNIAKVSGISVHETLERLKNAGLASLPGGGAEVLSDRVRSHISPRKIKSQEWLDVMETAHKVGLSTTATMMMGSIDTIEDRLEHLRQIRFLQDRTGGFRAFIAWTYQPGNTELGGRKTDSLEYLRFIALSRLYLDNFDHIQGSWVTQGKQIGQLSLYFGADDLGSVMLEENVVKAAGTTNEISLADMIETITGTGHRAAQRDSTYRHLRYFEPVAREHT